MIEPNASKQIADLLNKLIKIQPSVADLLSAGIPASEGISGLEGINVRPTEKGDYITVPGIITAISQLLGERIGSVYDENYKLLGFSLEDRALITPESFGAGTGANAPSGG